MLVLLALACHSTLMEEKSTTDRESELLYTRDTDASRSEVKKSTIQV